MDNAIELSNESEKQDVAPKILVVDDRPENHRAIEKILEYTDAEIHNAHSGMDALSLSLRHKFSVILLDVMMPNMDGFETATLLRVNEDTKTVPIIFITAADRSEEFEYKGYELGAVDYLFKPVNSHTLSSKVKILLQMEVQKEQLKQTLEDIQRLKNRNQLILNSVGEGIIGINKDGEIIFTNPAAEHILGMTEAQLKSLSILDILKTGNPTDGQLKWTKTPLYDKCRDGQAFHEPIAGFRHANSSILPIEYTATPIKENDRFIGVVIAFQDITERKKAEEQLVKLAQYDSLTGLLNRYAFGQSLTQALSRAKRSDKKLNLLFLDLDKFKQVNDTLSHEIGDCLLQEVAQRLKNVLRDGDILGRLGGDEFTIILETIENANVSNAATVCEKVITELDKPFYIHGHEVQIGASIGVAEYPTSATETDVLMRCADLAMYKAKDKGRNTYQFFTDEMQVAAEQALSLESQLKKAVINESFNLHYQPKVCLATGKTTGAEALLRWQDESNCFISPEVFVPKLEDLGLINTVGDWVLNRAAQDYMLINERFSGCDNFSLAINLSMKQLADPQIAKSILNTLNQFQLTGHQIEVEVTESMMMGDPETTISQLRKIHDLGVKIAIDDFGTGYSSLEYLQYFPIDTLKIDKSFTQRIGQCESSEKIVNAIVSLAKSLNLKIVAEGVETKEQCEYLRELECETIQGYYFSKPVPIEELLELVNKSWC